MNINQFNWYKVFCLWPRRTLEGRIAWFRYTWRAYSIVWNESGPGLCEPLVLWDDLYSDNVFAETSINQKVLTFSRTAS